MNVIEAIYHNGIFEPIGPIDLPENQRVHLSVQPIEVVDALAWLKRTRNLRARMMERHGLFPDSTPDIAADRLRDE
ncbi:MAG TPA: antitoxin family protein [Pirellulales bacterium]|nr:antitoxin family protein [Pirellulales bacterium]